MCDALLKQTFLAAAAKGILPWVDNRRGGFLAIPCPARPVLYHLAAVSENAKQSSSTANQFRPSLMSSGSEGMGFGPIGVSVPLLLKSLLSFQDAQKRALTDVLSIPRTVKLYDLWIGAGSVRESIGQLFPNGQV